MMHMVERLAKALHEEMCKQDIDGYLNAEIDCAVLARVAIEELREAGWLHRVYEAEVDAALAESKEG